jgi:hypothetical protein
VTSLVTRVHSLVCQGKIPPGVNGQLDPEGNSSSQRVGVRALHAHWNPVRHRNQRGEGRGAVPVRLERTWVRIQACFRRQKGRLITSQRSLFGMKPGLSG